MSAQHLCAHECAHGLGALVTGAGDPEFVVANDGPHLACTFRNTVTLAEGTLAALVAGPLLDEFARTGQPFADSSRLIDFVGKGVVSADRDDPAEDWPRIAGLLGSQTPKLGPVEVAWAFKKAAVAATIVHRLLIARPAFFVLMAARLDTLPDGEGLLVNGMHLLRMQRPGSPLAAVKPVRDLAAFELTGAG